LQQHKQHSYLNQKNALKEKKDDKREII